jgi:DEAD/DEAH box helicase domain-containing protein
MDTAVTQMQRNALWLGFLMVPSTPQELVTVKAEWTTWLQQLPDCLQSPGKGYAPSLSNKNFYPVLAASWPLAFAQGKMEYLSSPGVLVLDDLVDQKEPMPHLYWRRWLALFNTLQTLPGMVLATIRGIQAGDIDQINAVPAQSTAPAGSADQAALSQEWSDLLNLTLDTLRTGLRELAILGANPPTIGHELADVRGMVVAEAEMAWLAEHLIVLNCDQSDLADVWINAGWQVLVLDESTATINGSDWFKVVALKLGLLDVNQSNGGASA